MQMADEKFLFLRLCEDVFEKLKKSTTRDTRNEVLARFWEQYQSDDTYPVMRLLTPDLDSKRSSYGIKQDELSKRYVKALALAHSSKDAQRLLNYRKTADRDRHGKPTGAQGDFLAILFDVLSKRCEATPSNTTIRQVNDLLDELGQSKKGDGGRTKDAVFGKISKRLSPLEQMWLAAIIFKNLKLNIQSMAILRNYHPDGEEFYKRNSDLEEVCRKLADPNVRLDSLGMCPGSHVMPMLAKRLEREAMEEALSKEGGSFLVETKFDGWRVAVHKDGDEFKLFSRKGHDFTDHFMDIMVALKDKVKADRCIIDGEMCLWDEDSERLAPFEELKRYRPVRGPAGAERSWNRDRGRSREERDDSTIYTHRHLHYVAFDVLWLNGRVLTEQPLSRRLQLLQREVLPGCLDADPDVARSSPQREQVVVAHQKFVTRQDIGFAGGAKSVTQQVYEILEHRAVRGHDEGIMIKDPTSTYKPNLRSPQWIKLKPEYYRTEELDCVLLGGCFSEGPRMGGKLTHFLLGIALPRAPSVGDPEGVTIRPTKFHSFCRVGNFTDKDVALLSKLSWKKYDEDKLPKSWVPFRIRKQDRPDVVVAPEDSVIITVTGYQVLHTGVYSCGYTLRFPKKVAIRSREDKAWYDCATLQDVQNIFKRGQGAGRMFRDDGKGHKGTKKSRATAEGGAVRPSGMFHVPDHFRVASVDNVAVKTEIFKGIEFCVRNGVDSKPVPAPSRASVRPSAISHASHAATDATTLTTPLEDSFVPQPLAKLEPSAASSGADSKGMTRTGASGVRGPTASQSGRDGASLDVSPDQLTKAAITRFIVKNGGLITATPRRAHTSYVVAVHPNVLVKGDIQIDYDVVYRWADAGAWVPPRYDEVHHPGTLLRSTFLESMDMYGDFYAQETDVFQLQDVFERMGRGETILQESHYGQSPSADAEPMRGGRGRSAKAKGKTRSSNKGDTTTKPSAKKLKVASVRGRARARNRVRKTSQKDDAAADQDTDDPVAPKRQRSDDGGSESSDCDPQASSAAPAKKKSRKASDSDEGARVLDPPHEPALKIDPAEPLLKYPSSPLPVDVVLPLLGDDALDIERLPPTGLFRCCVVWVDFGQRVISPPGLPHDPTPSHAVALSLGLSPAPSHSNADNTPTLEEAMNGEDVTKFISNPGQENELWQSPLLIVPHYIRFYGGRLVEGIDKEVTHVVVANSTASERLDEIYAALLQTASSPDVHRCVVTRDWVSASVQEGALASEGEYKP